MSWQSKEDLGLSLVAHIHDSLKVEDKFRLDHSRGFTWWAGDHAQSVWSDLGIFHSMANYFRIHTEIELLSCDGHSTQCEIPLLEAMSDATFSAIIYDQEHDMYKLHCSMYACYDNEEWLKRVFLGAVGLQICEGHHAAKQLATQLNVSPATSAHRMSGMREHPHPMVEADERFFKPWGAQPSKWLGTSEWEDARQAIKRVSIRCSTDDATKLEGEFEWYHGEGNTTVKLLISAEEPHPALGSGLAFRLVVPVNMVAGSRAHLALHLNEMERREWNWCHDVGSWCCRGVDLAFDCFIPNISYSPGVLPEMAHDMSTRARWLNEQWQNMLVGASAG
jgi:hypothetical protein